MIRCVCGPEPAHFEARVRQRGQRWLAAHTSGVLPDYWQEVRLELAEAFHRRCGYSALYIGAGGQVDHFTPRHESRAGAYEWTNFRYCTGFINSSKQALETGRVLDPCQVEDGWFELRIPDLQVFVTERCPAELRERAEFTLDRLRLRDDERLLRARAEWWTAYQRGDISLEFLERMDPLLARAIRGRASGEDREAGAG